MRFYFKDRARGGIEFGIIYGGVALAALSASRFMSGRLLFPPCAFQGLTGMPCPTCGASRAFKHLAQGDIPASFAMNPLISAVLLIAVISFFYGLAALAFSLPRIAVALTNRGKSLLRAGASILVILNWLYLLVNR